MSFSRYVALGDSTTEGLEDPAPDGHGFLGFADRLAARLARENPEVLYANLAIRGRKMRQIRDEQLEPALTLRPDLVTVVGGLNDILRPRVALDDVCSDFDGIVSALRASGATVVGVTFPDPARIMPAARVVRGRVRAFNDVLRSIAARRGLVLVDLGERGVVDPRLWSVDRLHANSLGHQRITDAIAEALGLAPDFDPWEPLPPAERVARRVALAREAAWVGRHMTPWVVRRVRRRSSGDGVVAKRPTLSPVVVEEPLS